MIKIIGAALLLICAALWGRERGKKEKTALEIISELISFVTYAKEQITNFKTPLSRIYSEYYCETEEMTAFFSALSRGAVREALEEIISKIPSSAYKETADFLKKLGGGYSEGQENLCNTVKARLERICEGMKESLSEKVRMYRLLPLLLAASVIILLI